MSLRDETYELLYFDTDRGERDRVKSLIAAEYGTRARFEDDHDGVHGYRLAVWIEGETEDGWCEYAEQHGLTEIGLVSLSRSRFGS